MEATISRILHDLRIIAQIKIGDKISITDDRLDIDREGMLQPIVRTLQGSSRCQARSHITNTTNVAMAIITLLLESSMLDSNDLHRRHTLHNLRAELGSATKGISNMVITYHNDNAIVMYLESMLSSIQEFMANI